MMRHGKGTGLAARGVRPQAGETHHFGRALDDGLVCVADPFDDFDDDDFDDEFDDDFEEEWDEELPGGDWGDEEEEEEADDFDAGAHVVEDE